MCVTQKRTYVNKGCNLLNPYLLTVLLSIPFNKYYLVRENVMRPLLKNCKASMNKSLYNQCLANPEPIRIFGILSCRPWSKTTVGSTVEKPVFLIRNAKISNS